VTNYFVFQDLTWLPPQVRGRCAELMALAAERAAEVVPTTTGIYPLAAFAGKYWYGAVSPGALRDWPLPIADEWTPASQLEHFCPLLLSTEDIEIILNGGFEVDCIEGPFESRGAAQHCLDLHWER